MTVTDPDPKDACARCDEAIDVAGGDPYAAIVIQRGFDDPQLRKSSSENVAIFHEDCARRGLTHTVANNINDTLRSTP